jgi:hypothetical protein
MVPCFLFPDLCQKPAQKLVNYLQKRAKKRPKTHFFLSTVELVEVVFQKTVEVVQNNARPLTSNRPTVLSQEPFCIQNGNQHQPKNTCAQNTTWN